MKMGDSLGRSRRGRRKTSPDAPDREGVGPADPDSARDPGQPPPREAASPAGRPSRGRSRPWPHLTGWNLVGGVVGLALTGWFVGYLVATQIFFPAPPPPGDLFDVPDLRGLGLASASERLAGSGLALGSVDSLQHPSVAAGVILGQAPLPGQVLQPSTPVRVTISTGPQTRSVPDVRRLDESRARIVLETSGFVVHVASIEAEEPRGQVVDVTPSPGEVVELPAGVTLTVSTGPPVVAMPLVLGMELAEAEATIDSLGLTVSDVEEVFRFGRDQGIVVEQEPAADTELRSGSGVRLKVGRRGREPEQ